MIVSFPQTYVEMTEQGMSAFDLSSVRLWFNGGDAAHETHIRTLISYGQHEEDGSMRPGSVFIDGMGSSEMGFSLFRHVHTPSTNHYNRCVGKPLDWVEASVFSDEDKSLGPGKVGRLAVKAPSVTSGYWNDTALTMRSKIQGYFLTGDLAYYDEEGYFYHVDRIPDVIHTSRGPVYSLQTEEYLMSQFPFIIDCSVVKSHSRDNSEQAEVYLRCQNSDRYHGEELLKTFNTYLISCKLNPISKVTLVETSRIPLGTTGKVLKRQLRIAASQIEEGRAHV